LTWTLPFMWIRRLPNRCDSHGLIVLAGSLVKN
jgi:hypothetical protein